VQWSDAQEHGPLLGAERVGQCVSEAKTARNRGKARGGKGCRRGERREEIKRVTERTGAMR